MTSTHEAFVASRFDALQARFRPIVGATDVRLLAVQRALEPLQGRVIVDLGCGKGRFARIIQGHGAQVIGLDRSIGMLRAAHGCARVRASALRLPLADASVDGVMAIEVFEHLPRGAIYGVLAEMRRVLRPGGRVAIVDKNAHALDARRPWLPRVAIKWLDERRGLWMYRPGEAVRERWFWPARFRMAMVRVFEGARTQYLLSEAERESGVFRRCPWLRSMVCWTGRAPGACDA